MSKKNLFKLPYIGIETDDDELHLLLGQHGECSAVLRMTNPVVQYSANPSEYLSFHQNMLNILKILGEGFWLQKLDVLSREAFQGKFSGEYLQQKYDQHFGGRIYTRIRSFLVITRPAVKRSEAASKKAQSEFKAMVMKVMQSMELNGLQPRLLREREMDQLVMRTLTMDFASPRLVLDNLQPEDTHIRMGDRLVKCISLIDIDRIDLPEKVSPYIERNDKDVMKGFPVDSMFFLHQVPGFDVLIYNQVLEIPRQVQTIQKLQLKKKRHSGIPDPENDLCVADIETLLEDVARENQLLVNAHFSLVIAAPENNLTKAVNNVENALFLQGIIPSRNSYNQLELFRSALIGNAVELKHYDLYLTTSDAALSFFFKESLPVSEPAPKGFSIRFTDRQGIPIGIDPADYSREIGRINNRNKFVLGPSGSGKSFFMNALIEQYLLYNMDVVIVDTGDSYSGISSYLGGKYITYKEDKPISMNPFIIAQGEFNLEKKDFLVTLVGLLWKGADGKLTQVESDVINEVVIAYYRNYFGWQRTDWMEQAEIGELVESFCIQSLDFNSFYEFALRLIPLIRKREQIHFDLDVFRFVLKKFYRGGEFEGILNEATDSSLFDEPLIVFEIDSIKGAPVKAA